MWENEHRKRIITNIILAVLILAILSALAVVMLRVHQQTKAHDEELSAIYTQQQQQQTEERQESVAAIQAEYDKDMQTVAAYLPGIVCWGDSITLGSSGNISYPAVLKTYLDTYFCDIYDFRSTIENAEEYSRLKWDEYKVSVPVVNMGAAAEDSCTVLGRAGAVPYVLMNDIIISGEPEEIPIRISSEDGRPVTPLAGGDVGVNSVRIGDVEGTLSLKNAQYYFTRNDQSATTMAPAGTPVVTAATGQYCDYIHVVCIGTYGSFYSPQELVEQTKQLLARQTGNSDRFLVLGLCSVNRSTGNTYMLDQIDAAMTQAFGNRYINVRRYLVEDGMSDAGISPTTVDKNRAKLSMVPLSLMASATSVELTGKAYALIGKLVYDRMESLGYFDEVFKELGIRETRMQILKENPKYFEDILASKLS